MWQQTLKPRLNRALEAGREFSEPEAWRLFRLAAFAEAIGWTLLILGIVITTYVTPGNRDAVVIAGQLHGTIFFAYILAAAVFSISLGWSPAKTVIALAVSVPPYGTLVFERWAARSREIKEAENYRRLEVRALITNKSKILVIQPPESSQWQLPGGQVKAHESATEALNRYIVEQTGIVPMIGDTLHIQEIIIDKKLTISLYFAILNSPDYGAVTQIHPQPGVDEISFIEPALLHLPWLNKDEGNSSKSQVFQPKI